MLKNTASQKWIVFAFDSTTNLAKTGDAANITANLRKDYGSANAVADTNPTELENGFYAFDLAQAESNADHLLLCPASVTANIVVIGCPAVIFTEPAGRKYPASLAAADVSGNVPVDVSAIQSGLAQQDTLEAVVGYIDTEVSAIKLVTDELGNMLEIHDEVSRFTANALGEAPSGSASVIFPVMQGQVYSATAIQSADVKIVQGDTPELPFDLGDDYSGWTPYFGAKASLDDDEYIIAPKAGSWADATEGQGSVTLTTTDTATPGKYFAEIELRNGDSRLTAMKFNLVILRAVIVPA